MLLQVTKSHQLACMPKGLRTSHCLLQAIVHLLCLCANLRFACYTWQLAARSQQQSCRARLMQERASWHLWRTFSSISTS